MLKQVLVGPSGLRSSELALGSMTFGETSRWGCEQTEAKAILGEFVSAGGTYIDTAPNYANGDSERIIGEFARDRRDELVLSTKYTASSTQHPLAGGNSRRSMLQSVEASPKRLQTDRIDLLWLHYWDFTTPLEEILRAADDLVSAGKILYFGLSDMPAWLAARAVTMAEQQRRVPVVALQMEYNVATRGVERDLLPMANALGLSAFCWGPLAAGALAGGSAPQRLADRKPQPAMQAVGERLQRIAANRGTTPRHLALRWIMQASGSCIPIVGARSASQMREMLADVTSPLDAQTMQEIDALVTVDPLFPYRLIESSYLRKFALGTPDRFTEVRSPRK